MGRLALKRTIVLKGCLSVTVLDGKKSKVFWTSFTDSNSEKGRKEGGERLWHLEMFHDFKERKAKSLNRKLKTICDAPL